MPFYKLLCTRCGEAFEKQASIAEKTEKAIPCPACGSTEVQTDYRGGSAGVLKTNRASAGGCPHAGDCGCGCHGK